MKVQGLDHREDLRRRLRRLGLVRGTKALPPSRRRRVALETLINGRFHETSHGRCFVAEHEFPAGHLHGNLPLEAFLRLAPSVLAAVGGDPALASADPSRAVFLDTETTGLSGGTGTMAFLVGLGFFEGDRFHLLQVFLRDPSDEPAMIEMLADVLPQFEMVVTFNGRGFDLPILETRFILARRPFPLALSPHLDLLPPSRRLWRLRLASCALGTLEREVLGVQRDQADVPSGVIPYLYRDYLQTGDAREIPRILYHNRVDVLSMVVLAARLGRALTHPLEEPGLTGPDLLALARWLAQTGGEAERTFRAALAAGLPRDLHLRALRDLALLLKRAGRREEAVEWWQQLALEEPEGLLALVELAKTFEWHIPRLELAAAWTRVAMARARRWPPGPRRERALRELERRAERIRRKKGLAPFLRSAQGGDPNATGGRD